MRAGLIATLVLFIAAPCRAAVPYSAEEAWSGGVKEIDRFQRDMADDGGTYNPLDKSRPLTAGEIEMASAIFRDGIDYSSVTIKHFKWSLLQPDDRVKAPNGHIYYPRNIWSYKDDIAQAGLGAKELLIHELTHVYQYQQGINVVAQRFSEGGIYKYQLLQDKSLLDYTIEQQASIIADYYSCTQQHPLVDCRKKYLSALKLFWDDANYIRKNRKNPYPARPRRRNNASSPGVQ